MHTRRNLSVLAAAAALAFGTPSPASAAPESEWRAPEVAWVSQNVATTDGGETARLLVKYRCWGTGAHLWGSAKQGPQIDPTVAGGTSSARATSWRETPEGPAPTCTGDWVTERVTVQATEDTEGKDALTAGRAWVQFVIFAFDPEGGFGADGWPNVFGRGAVDPGQWVDVRGATRK